MSEPKIMTFTAKQGAGQVKVMVKGEGEPVVFLHGAGGLKWDSYLEELAQKFKVYAPLFPGTLGTANTVELDLRNVWDLVLHYIDILDVLELDAVHLIGHSFGGMLAAELAATHPQRVTTLLLLCPTGVWDAEIAKIVKNAPGDINDRLFYDPESPEAKAYFALPEDKEEMLKHYLEEQIVASQASRYLWPIPDKGLIRRLYRIEAKTTIVWGREDTVVPVQYAEIFQKHIKHSCVEIYEQTAHYPQLEQKAAVLKTSFSLFGKESIRVSE